MKFIIVRKVLYSDSNNVIYLDTGDMLSLKKLAWTWHTFKFPTAVRPPFIRDDMSYKS